MACRPMAVACSLVGLFGPAPSIAHDWYPLDCCGNRDCRELVAIKGETVTEVPEGWRLWDGRINGRAHRMEVREPSRARRDCLAVMAGGGARAPLRWAWQRDRPHSGGRVRTS
jgi:hypothetical protein